MCLIIFFKFYFIVFTFIYMCTHYLGHLPPPTPGRTCSTLLFSDFVEEKNINDNKKTMAFCYTGRFLVLFPCIYVLQPTLVHLYQISSLLSSPLPIMASASLRLLYLLLIYHLLTLFLHKTTI
jgi:hypothetical protein